MISKVTDTAVDVVTKGGRLLSMSNDQGQQLLIDRSHTIQQEYEESSDSDENIWDIITNTPNPSYIMSKNWD